MGGQTNVYAYNVIYLFLFTLFVYVGWVGGQKSLKFCLRSYLMAPNLLPHPVGTLHNAYVSTFISRQTQFSPKIMPRMFYQLTIIAQFLT